MAKAIKQAVLKAVCYVCGYNMSGSGMCPNCGNPVPD